MRPQTKAVKVLVKRNFLRRGKNIIKSDEFPRLVDRIKPFLRVGRGNT